MTELRAQMLPGCRLVAGNLQCVPGLTADPQEQIRILDRQIQADLQTEGSIQQTIQGISRLQLSGDAAIGALLIASVTGALPSAPPGSIYHWYRQVPGSERWLLIKEAGGQSYLPVVADTGAKLMVVLVVTEADGVKRIASPPIGPIRNRN